MFEYCDSERVEEGFVEGVEDGVLGVDFGVVVVVVVFMRYCISL